MKPLKSLRKWLKWLCVFPITNDETTLDKIWCKIFTFIIFCGNLFAVIASAAFIFKYMKSDLQKSLYALFQFGSFFIMSYTMVMVFFVREKIIGIFEKLFDIYKKNENDDSYQFLIEADGKSESVFRTYIIVSISSMSGLMVMSSISIIACWIKHGHFDPDFVFHPHQIVLPWNQRTLFGYIGEVVFAVSTSSSYMVCNGMILLMFISTCFQHQAFYKMFQHTLNKLSLPKAKKSNTELLCSLVQFHASIKNWFLLTANVYSRFIMIILICNTISLSCALFQLDAQLSQLDFSLSTILAALFLYIFHILLYCYLGKIASESYEKLTYCLYESNWMDLSIELQKYFLIINKNTQNPLFYHGFGMVNLNLETFSKLIRTVFSYYMMFKALEYK